MGSSHFRDLRKTTVSENFRLMWASVRRILCMPDGRSDQVSFLPKKKKKKQQSMKYQLCMQDVVAMEPSEWGFRTESRLTIQEGGAQYLVRSPERSI